MYAKQIEREPPVRPYWAEKAATWYLAGPMSGVPKFNIPLFDEVAARLRGAGYKIVSPAELDSPTTRARCAASLDGAPIPELGTWGDFLSRDVKLVADRVDGIILLPGWERSRGARLEAFVGLLTDKWFSWWDPMTEFALSVHNDTVRRILTENMP